MKAAPHSVIIRIGDAWRVIRLPRTADNLSGPAKEVIDAMLKMYHDEELRAAGEKALKDVLGDEK